jgi:hypothetical protein
MMKREEEHHKAGREHAARAQGREPERGRLAGREENNNAKRGTYRLAEGEEGR